jgi:hypothetical protein
MSALFPSRSQYFSAASGFRSHQESMGSFSSDLVRLIGSLACHRNSLYFFLYYLVNHVP